MAFYITKPGNPNLTILTDGGSLQIGTGLQVDNDGKLNVTGEGVATDVFFSNIQGEPTDNTKLAEALALKADKTDLADYIRINGTTQKLDAQRINFYTTDDGETRTVGSIKVDSAELGSPIYIDSDEGVEFRQTDKLAFDLPNVRYTTVSTSGSEEIRTTWPQIINTANGESDVYAKTTDITQLTQKIEDNELVISSALNDLNDRLLDVYNREEAEEEFTTKVEFREATTVTAASLNELNERKADASNVYTKEEIDAMIERLINTYHSE